MPQILVIDDDPIIRVLLRQSLQKQGYDVTVATDGLQGLTQAKELHPDLIICDWMMPHLDGLKVCHQIKTDPNLATTYFILLTARGAIEDRVRGLDTGADDFLSKPIELGELQARVRAGLRLCQLTKDLQFQKQVLEAELVEAASYVQSLLPKPLKSAVQIDSRFIPSRQLGGDSFDYFWLDPDYLVMYLLDVSGHGLGAALPSITVLNLLRSQVLPDVNFYQPHDVLRALNEAFQMDSQHDKYFTIWYGVYNRVKRQLAYASAGHPPAILVTQNSDNTTAVKRLKTKALPIGVMADATFVSDRLTIPSHSSLYIFSDGVYDLSQEQSEAWGLDAFVDLLSQQGIDSNLDQILDCIRQSSQMETFPDDLSLLQIDFG